MADITDIKTILYTEKTIEQQDSGVMVVQTSQRVTKNSLKQVFKEYFGVVPLKVNSLNQKGKTKKFRGKPGTRPSFKKFYVSLPHGAEIANLSA
ncbi:MAG: 50S ribosomal protein L23 [Campylobacteraceae bacterium 4484_166]|nr:MAG: 50S ribosomal protein L23 [Campylobacteraceae bacterium 4484_166]